MWKSIMVVCVLEATGLSAVPWQLWRAPVRAWLRVAKPVLLLVVAFLLSQALGDSLATLCLVANAAYATLLHRAYCGPGWLRQTSPYLYRNPKQIALWTRLAGSSTS